MPEFIKTAEVIGNIAEKVYHVGKYVVDTFKGGAWAELPHGELAEPRLPVRANITYYHSEDNLIKGEE